MVKDLFFNRLVTKDMQPVHGGERFFEGYLTVQIKDKQGEITVVDELYKVLPVWMDRGAPISDTHSNRIIGKGINYSKATYKDKDGEEYPAIKITGKIHKDYELDNEIWKKIKSGEYKGLSFGGATKSDRDPVRMKDGSIAYSLKDLEHYEVAVCADPAVPLALITDYNPVAKSATNAEVREDGKMIIKCDKFGCYVTKKEECHFCNSIASGGAILARKDDPEWEKHEKEHQTKGKLNTDILDRINAVTPEEYAVAEAEANQEISDAKKLGKADNITKPIPDGKGGKGDFDHCEEKNQDKNDPAAFCGAIQHKLEKAIEAGMLQQVTKDGLEIFLTKEELNKVCSGCGKTLGEHGIVKYDHSNSMGDQHSMYNQNTGRETWVGQGLPQPTVEGKDDHPAEQGLTINGDARQNSGKKKKGRTARNRKRRKEEIVDAEIGSMVNQSFVSIVKAKDSDDSEDVTPIKGADDNQRASDYKCGVGGCGADAVTFAMQGKQDAEGKKTYRKDPKTGKIITTPLCRNCAEKLQRGALERGVTVHHDYEEEDKDVGKSFESIFKDEAERRERQGEKERKRNQNFFGDFSGDPDKMTPTPEQIANKKIRDAKEAEILARKKLKRGKKKKSFELFKDSVDGKQGHDPKPFGWDYRFADDGIDSDKLTHMDPKEFQDLAAGHAGGDAHKLQPKAHPYKRERGKKGKKGEYKEQAKPTRQEFQDHDDSMRDHGDHRYPILSPRKRPKGERRSTMDENSKRWAQNRGEGSVRGDELGAVEHYKRQMRRGGKPEAPLLGSSTDSEGRKVTGHEGRHRAQAAIEEGEKTIPVAVNENASTMALNRERRMSPKELQEMRGEDDSPRDKRQKLGRGISSMHHHNQPTSGKVREGVESLKSFELFKDSVDGKQSPTREPASGNSTRQGRGISPQRFQGQSADARALDVPRTTSGFNQRKREQRQLGDVTIPSIERKLQDEKTGRHTSRSRAPRPQGGQSTNRERKPRKSKEPKKWRGREGEKLTLGNQKRTDQPIPPKVNPTPTEHMKRPSKYTKEEWDKLPDFFKERDFKAQSDELKELQRKVDILSQPNKYPYKEKRPAETKEDWKKIDDAAQSERAKEIEDRAASGIQYGKSFGFISKKKPQKMRATVGWKQFIEDSLKDPKVPKEWKAGLRRNRKLFEHLEGNEPPSSDKVTMEDSTPKEPNQLGIIDPSKPMTKKDPNIFWGSKDDLDDTEDDDSTEPAIGNIQQNKRIFSGLKEKSLVNKRDDWDKEEKDNTDEYFGRKKEKPWTSRDQSEYDAFEKLSKLPKERLDKLHEGLQEAIDGIKLDAKIREGMIGAFGKSFVSIVDKSRVDDLFNEKRSNRKDLRHQQAGQTGVTEIGGTPEKGADKHRVSLSGGESGGMWAKEVGSDFGDVIAAGDELKDEATRALKLDEKPAQRKYMRRKLREDAETAQPKVTEGVKRLGEKPEKKKPFDWAARNRGEGEDITWYDGNWNKRDLRTEGMEGLERKKSFVSIFKEDDDDKYPSPEGKSTIDRIRAARDWEKKHPKKPFNQEEYDKHTDEEKEDIRLARYGGKGGKVALPMVERKIPAEPPLPERSRPSLYGETVRRRGRTLGMEPEQVDRITAMGTISQENAETYKSFVSIVKGDAEANPDMSPQEWLQWYKKRPKKKAEESNFGAGQRGLGYGNEGYTNVQGSGQSHTITEIPPEMEVIVHDVKDIKESKKEGYTTEAGNNKRGDPSRATDDDDSLLSPTFAKKEYGRWLSPKKPKDEADDDNYFDSVNSDDESSSNSLASNFDEPW